MDQVWWVAVLWILVGLAATVIAVWMGGTLRDEITRLRKHSRQLPQRQ